jgi:hypothetical protein
MISEHGIADGAGLFHGDALSSAVSMNLSVDLHLTLKPPAVAVGRQPR